MKYDIFKVLHFLIEERSSSMKQKFTLLALVSLVLLFCSAPAFSASVDDLKRQIDLLSDEVDDLKGRSMGSSGTTDHNRVSVHGYGELHLNVPTSGNNNQTQIDQHRFVIGVHALLTDWIHLNAEIDFEHAGQELEFEFGYLDFLLSDALNVRAGVVIVPVGFLNEYHEPPLFWTAERPLLQSRMIPTTWSGAGAGFFGSLGEGVSYRAYVVNSLQSIKDNSTSGGSGNGNGGDDSSFDSNGIRGGRGQINKRVAEDFAFTGRLEFTKLYPGLQVGLSTFLGNTTQGFIDEGGFMSLLEADIQYRWNWLEMNSTVVVTHIADTTAMENFCGIAGNGCSGGVAERQFGFNIQAGIHLPQLMGWKTTHDIIPHIMFERVRTQDKMAQGVAHTLSRNRNAVYTFGVAYLPIPAVSIKADHTNTRLANGNNTDQFNMAVSYMY
jgi:hypothetical protein